MIPARQVVHLLRITRVFVRHGLDEFIQTLHLFRPVRLALRLLPWAWFRRSDEPRAVRLRQALEDLGPVFVKAGQILSTRPDLLPEDIVGELRKLQDQVPAFPGDQAVAVIERSYGDAIDRHFARFDREALASASVAQVHTAELSDGREVVVKVIRPGIVPVIERDIALLYTLAGLAEKYWDEGPRLRPIQVVDEISKTIHDELDLRREAANASQLRHNFADSDIIHVPEVFWDHTRRDVMVMERIEGIPIREVDRLRESGIDMRKLAHDGVEIFFTQAFRDGFFHADMHPGNIFVSSQGQYRAVDFGIMGVLSDADKRYLAENFLAFFHRDYKAVAEAHLRAGWIPSDTRVEEFEAAIRTVCEPIFARPISEISFGRFLLQLFQTARRFRMPVQPQLVLLQKTLLNIEGLGRQLYPQLDLWETAKPFLEKWMSEQVGPRAAARSLRRELPRIAVTAPEIPGMLHDLLGRLRDIEPAAAEIGRQVRRIQRQNRRHHRRVFYTLTGCTCFLGAILLAALDGYAPAMLGKLPLASWLLGILGLFLLVMVWPQDSDD